MDSAYIYLILALSVVLLGVVGVVGAEEQAWSNGINKIASGQVDFLPNEENTIDWSQKLANKSITFVRRCVE